MQSFYTESVPESASPGRLILQVSATDADIRSNAQISYELVGPGAQHFTIDPDTGTNKDVHIMTPHLPLCIETSKLVHSTMICFADFMQ